MRVQTSEGGLSGETLKLGLGAGLTQQTTDRVSACVSGCTAGREAFQVRRPVYAKPWQQEDAADGCQVTWGPSGQVCVLSYE